MPFLPSLKKGNSVPLEVPKVPPPAASCAPWVITSLVLMGLNSYFPQLSPVSSLWSPLRAAIPVLHWVASWWFVSPGREPNLRHITTRKPTITKLLPATNSQTLAAIEQMPTDTAQTPTTLASPTCKPSSNQAPMSHPATCQPLPSHASRPVPIHYFRK
ncbi:hypothetical protein DSO57_1012880 [Entomophthora muscae]|uniref:Uncharacterized protein n=1 Tax=Entomophthora muscae TaxID=34485 RepID=A0ACC2TTA9_9FUNG|nr:hypothetical protein DSO57_1012880 [Entomophthora muscae]